MKREFYEFAGEISDDNNIIETTLREEVDGKNVFKKIKNSFFKNLVWLFLNIIALSIIELIFQTLGIKILSSGTISVLNFVGLGIAYLFIFVGVFLMNLKPIKENSMFKDLILDFLHLSP